MTLYSESFTKDDSTDLGPGLAWTELAGDWQVLGGSATMLTTSTDGKARAVADTGSPDMYIQGTLVAGTAMSVNYVDAQLHARVSGSGTYTSYALLRGFWTTGGGAFVAIRRYTAIGTSELLGSTVVLAYSLPETWKLVVEGDTITAFRNGVEILSRTDSVVTTGNYGAIGGYRSSNLGTKIFFWDDIEIADLAGGAPAPTTPLNFEIDDYDGTFVDLVWDEVPGMTYRVQRETFTGTWGDQTTLSSSVSTETYTDSPLDPAVRYRYRVSSTDGTLVSGWTGWLQTPLSSPDSAITDFTVGTTLPLGWAYELPTPGGAEMTGSHLRLFSSAGVNSDSISSGHPVPEGAMVWRTVSGPFDFAVAMAADPTTLSKQGIDLLAMPDGSGGVRACLYCNTVTGTFRNDQNYYVYTSDGGSKSVTGNTSVLYGAPGWLRLTYDGAGNYVFYQSRTGLGGSWVVISSFTSTIVPTRFAIHNNSTAGADAVNGREQHIARVVDLLLKGHDEAADPVPTMTKSVVHTYNGEGTVPVWASVSEANNGEVAIVDDAIQLLITNEVAGSHAGVMFGALGTSHGMLIRYRVVQGYTNAFWVPLLALEPTTPIPGAQVVDDKWGEGNCMLMEMPARVGTGTADRTVRMLRRSEVQEGMVMTGNREFDGYAMLHEDLAFPIDTGGSPWTMMRFEKLGPRTRVRIWDDGDPEPTEWDQEVDDWAIWGSTAGITLGSNDTSAGGSSTCRVQFSDIEVYKYSAPAALDVTLSVLLPGGTEVEATVVGVLLPGGSVVEATTQVLT
jgi:hypothetical protein